MATERKTGLPFGLKSGPLILSSVFDYLEASTTINP